MQVIAERPYICQGESVKLSAFGAGASQFTWLPAQGLGTINGAEAIVQPTVTTTYTVIGSGSCHSDTARITVVVAPPAYVNAGPDQSICSGATVQLGTSPQPGYNYTWHTSTNLSDSTIANPTFSVVNTGSTNRAYQFIVTMDGPGATCGKDKDTVQITVKPQIAVNAGSARTFCSGIPTVLQPQQYNSAYAYSWSPTTGLSNANTFAPTLTLTNTSAKPDTLTYTLTATFNGCSRSSPVQVIVLPEPRPVIYGPASVCPGSPQITYQVQNPIPGNSYIWGVRGGSLSQTFGDSIWVNWGAASATATVWALGSNRFNCPGDTVFFPVLINPLLQTEKPKGNDTLCENDKQNQLYQLARAQGSVYTWGIRGGSIVSGQSSHAVRVNWPGPGQYKLWVQESAQTSLAQCYGVSDTLRITVLPSPDTTLAVQGPASVCEQSQQSYSLAGNPGSIYHWQVIGGAIIGGQGSGSVQVNWQTVGQGEVKVQETLPNGCVGNWLTLFVQVNPIPVTTSPVFNTFCPEALTRTHQVQGMPGSAFQWQVSGGTLLSGQGTSQTTIRWDSLSVNPSYSVIETSASGCSSAPHTVAVEFDRSALKLLSVGLDEAEENLIIQYKLQHPPLTPPVYLNIFAQNSQTGQWESIGQSSLANTVFRAPAAAFEMRHYRLQGRNYCSNELYSKAHRPVKLTAAGQENSGEVKLSWNAYKGWPGTVQYEVWRQLEGQTAFEKLAVTTDSSLSLKTGRDGFRQRYRIKAVSASGRESWSQSVGVEFQNELGFPNIITPNNDRLNDTFTASNLHLYPNSSLKIFNRWGQEVFSSQHYRGEWQAEGLSSGTYYYLLQTPNGKKFKGWVEVVK
ncbi:gliding motility-associated C-terminal domain-containing protein [Adhaeribacter sp. BT258]|uniref:Gliding motility-associated C-terminal domain-containing protein n=1 Tax=Adhaeribacter terrigena TaxID=2793070 RepID=A0ABS1BWK0_9BACT|nr:gliding motility-associated C-terminal domain-containing protein [Adhaeribacter terrigena]MBK0401491.1 gliding motility-associated C-terminal domain-containing protein [Adhaeribacter terrigena]